MWEKLTNKKAKDLIAKVEKPFQGLPHLPQGLLDFLVKITPWGVGLGGVFSLMGAVSNLRYGLGMSHMGRVINYYTNISPLYFLVTAVFQLALAIIAFKAFNPLKEHKLEGWIYLFWSNLITVAQGILGVILLSGSGMGFIVGALIGFYLLFELKVAFEPKNKEAKAKKTAKK